MDNCSGLFRLAPTALYVEGGRTKSVHRPGESQCVTREMEKEGNVAAERKAGRRRERDMSMGSCWP